MPALTSADVFNYFVNIAKGLEAGQLPAYVDPAAPVDLGTALTQADIDSMKVIRNEIQNRFNPPPEG